jgi:DNA-binding response OmpR family regulator
MGMDSETRDHIFEPFFTTKSRGRGTGLGLATTYGIIKQSEGSVIVDSEPGHGTTFRIYFPTVMREAPAPGEAGVAAGRRVPAGRRSGRILLVEDEPGLRDIAQRVLARAGFEVTTAAGPDEAILAAESMTEPIDLLLSDVVMPGCAARSWRSGSPDAGPGLRVLLVSGYAEEIVEGGRDDSLPFLAKPFSAESLLAAVDAALARTHGARAGLGMGAPGRMHPIRRPNGPDRLDPAREPDGSWTPPQRCGTLTSRAAARSLVRGAEDGTLAGPAFPSGRDRRPRRHQLRRSLRHRRRRHAVPLRRGRRGAADCPAGAGRRRLARLRARGRAGPALRLPRLGPVRAGPGSAATPTSCSSIRTPGPSPARSTWGDASWATCPATRTASAAWTRRRTCRAAWSFPATSTGATTPRPRSPTPTRSSTRPTSRASPSSTRACRRAARHVRRPGLARRRSTT